MPLISLGYDELVVLDWVLNSDACGGDGHQERAAEQSGVENSRSVLQMVRGKTRVALNRADEE